MHVTLAHSMHRGLVRSLPIANRLLAHVSPPRTTPSLTHVRLCNTGITKPLHKQAVMTALQELDPRHTRLRTDESPGEATSRRKRLQEKLKRHTPRDGKPNSGRQMRANVVLQVEVAELFERRDLHVLERIVPRLARNPDAVVEIVDVQMSSDLSHCTVFWDPPMLLKGKLKERQLRAIERALYHASVIGRIRTFVAKRLKTRKAPHVRFSRAKVDEALQFMKSI